MAGLFDNIFGGGAGSMFGGGGGIYGSMLTPEQQAAIRQQSMMAMATKLLEGSGPSTTRRSLGQIAGSALSAGAEAAQTGQTNAVQQLLVKQKLDEAKAEQDRRNKYRQMLTGTPTRPAAPVQPPALIGGDAEGMIAPSGVAPVTAPQPVTDAGNVYANLTPLQRALLAEMPEEQGMKFILDQTVPKEDPTSIREYRLAQQQGFKGSFLDYKNMTVPRTVLDMTGGQKGFDNEMKLGSAFKGETTYKEFNDMKSAFKQVVSSLSQGTPIGDVAGATKIMKLLDPGSVVRESELGIAMAAAGRLDRLQNYFNNMMTGQILTPTQRQDFERLATELYAAAADGYNKKRDEYMGLGQAYGFKNLDTVLGPKADVPSLMRTPPAAGGGGGTARPPLANIFGGNQ